MGEIVHLRDVSYEHKPAIGASIQERRKLAEDMKEQRVGSRHKPLYL